MEWPCNSITTFIAVQALCSSTNPFNPDNKANFFVYVSWKVIFNSITLSRVTLACSIHQQSKVKQSKRNSAFTSSFYTFNSALLEQDINWDGCNSIYHSIISSYEFDWILFDQNDSNEQLPRFANRLCKCMHLSSFAIKAQFSTNLESFCNLSCRGIETLNFE